ncbi:hypothetical protein BN59_00281 [Legionella massiliensis]|uniref:YqaE/Pmp3 family membrane protein n=1 Tax=Legionella massiliensis TaxID=1034943 RepID=A0A078KSU2_9GAMM|nr:hypothetical protein [Legionella massiliensis]CDZ76017.1 hypothetical protein BN59_00281 [Legionella massiliensis]CEE11755.1 hypothetical protein BN1094_00281 [Legionella massiliensis]
MIVRMLMSLVAILFPWLILLLEDNPGGAVIALIMQASVFGWPFAAVWALRTLRDARKARKAEKEAEKVEQYRAEARAEQQAQAKAQQEVQQEAQVNPEQQQTQIKSEQ